MNQTLTAKIAAFCRRLLRKTGNRTCRLTEIDNRYRILFETSHDALMTLAPPDWAFTDCNPATLNLFKVKNRDTFITASPWELSPEFQPDGRPSRDKALEMIETAMQQGSHFFEWAHRQYEGPTFSATVLLTRIDHRDGAFLQATVRDISEQKNTDERIRTMAELLDIAPNSILIHDFDGKIMYANRKTLELHGYEDEKEFMSLNLHQIDVPESEALIAERMRRIEEKGEASFEVQHFRKDGTVFPLLVYGKKAFWQGKPVLLSVSTDITERKQAENDLRLSEDRFRLLFENAPVAYQSLDETGQFIEVNRAFLDTLGYQREEMIGKNFGDFLHPDYVDHFRENFPRFKAVGEILGVEFEMRKKDGSTILVHFNGKIQRDRTGRFKRTHCVFRDITEQKRAETALRENERKYRTLVEALPDIILRFDRDFRHVFVSENVDTVVDIPAERFIGRTHRELGFAEDQCRFWERALEKVFTTAEIFETEFTFDGKQGPMVFNWRLLPETDLQGNVASILSISRDITAQRRIESNYQMLFREMLSGFAQHEIIINDHNKPIDYRFLAVNPAFEDLTGLKAEDVIGKTVLEVIPDTELYWIEIYGQVALTGVPVTFENYSAEIQKYVHVSAFRPAPNQFACIFRDITKEKQLEEQIRQTEKMESIGRLAGGIAHDFNNMLSVILGHVNVLLEDTHPDIKTRLALESIEQAAERSADLTRQLLGFARKQVASPRTIDLNEAVEYMLRMLRRIVGENIELAWRPGESLWPVKIDPSQLDQIMVNLVANARKAIVDKGEVIITTANTSLKPDHLDGRSDPVIGEYVMLAISDNGCGMDREMQAHVFDPFFTTSEVGQGVGMGLATVYGIVKQNNGYIYVDSEPDRGSLFTIYFPRQTARTSEAEKPAETIPAPVEWETVLLVEDDQAILEMCRMMLERLGYAVLTAKTAVEAIDIAKTYPEDIHLLITDVIMPEMNGSELADRLGEIRPDLKCLFMSGYTADIIAGQGVLSEDMPFISKPFTKKDLDAKIRDIFKDG